MIHCYKLCGYNIVLDIASGSIHVVDVVAYDVIRMYEYSGGGNRGSGGDRGGGGVCGGDRGGGGVCGGDDQGGGDDRVIEDLVCDDHGGGDRDELIKRAMEIHSGITESDILEIIADIESLKDRGTLFSPDTFAAVAETGHKAPLKALCLNVSHLCNMSCSYCFASRSADGSVGEYDPHSDDAKCSVSGCSGRDHNESDSGNQNTGGGNGNTGDAERTGSGGLMPLETGKRAIDFLVENSGKRKTLDIDFFGGEPLLNWQVVKDIVRYARDIERGSGKKFRFTLTTNALLIDDDVIAFTNREMHNVVLSLDGRQEIHDAKRKLPGGGGSYSEVIPKIKKLVEARRGKGYYIRGTFTRDNIDFTSDVLHMADLGFKELSMEPVVTKSSGQACQRDSFTHDHTGQRNIGQRSIGLSDESSNTTITKMDDPGGFSRDDLPELFRQYESLAVEMLRREKLGGGFTFYHYILDLAGGPCVYKRIAGCGVATEYLAVTPRGELYPCHRFVDDPAFLMGNVWRGITNNKLRDEFSGCSIYSRSQCSACWARFYCSGGCAANAHYMSGSIGGVYQLGCELFKKRVECAIMMHVATSSVGKPL